MYSPQGPLRGDPSGNTADTKESKEKGEPDGGKGASGAGTGGGAGVGLEFFPAGSDSGPSAAFVGHWLSFLGEQARVAPFLSTSSDVLQALQEVSPCPCQERTSSTVIVL